MGWATVIGVSHTSTVMLTRSAVEAPVNVRAGPSLQGIRIRHSEGGVSLTYSIRSRTNSPEALLEPIGDVGDPQEHRLLKITAVGRLEVLARARLRQT
jgi:hypothetical protein